MLLFFSKHPFMLQRQVLNLLILATFVFRLRDCDIKYNFLNVSRDVVRYLHLSRKRILKCMHIPPSQHSRVLQWFMTAHTRYNGTKQIRWNLESFLSAFISAVDAGYYEWCYLIIMSFITSWRPSLEISLISTHSYEKSGYVKAQHHL